MTEYKKIECSSFINRMSESLFTIRTYSIRLTANPYSGCAHSCAWCYAQYIHKFNVRYDPTVTPKDFSKKIFVKINAPQILEKELQTIQKKKLPREYCDLSTITDSYQPCEREFRITRQCLELFLKYSFPVTVLTRSNLILDDLDIWRQLAQKNIGVVGMSVTRPTTLDPQLKNFLEPFSPSTHNILHTLKTLNENKIPTFAFVDPIVPFMTDSEEQLSQLLSEIAQTGCKTIFFGVMKLNPLTWHLFKERLAHYDSSRIKQFEDLYIRHGEKEFSRSWQPPVWYRRELYTKARDICTNLGIGFSCEGGMYDLWLDDWCDIENPYRYPTGFNLWSNIKKSSHALSFAELQHVLIEQFPHLSTKYFTELEVLWNEQKLFADLPDIQAITVNGSTCYGWHNKT